MFRSEISMASELIAQIFFFTDRIFLNVQFQAPATDE